MYINLKNVQVIVVTCIMKEVRVAPRNGNMLVAVGLGLAQKLEWLLVSYRLHSVFFFCTQIQAHHLAKLGLVDQIVIVTGENGVSVHLHLHLDTNDAGHGDGAEHNLLPLVGDPTAPAADLDLDSEALVVMEPLLAESG